MAAAPLVVTQDQARSFFLSRQGLDSPFETPEDVVKQVFAVQTQYAASLGVAVAARVKRMKPSWPDAALNVNPTLFKTWSLRSTLHVHHVDDRALVKGFGVFRRRFYQDWMGHYDLNLEQLREQELRILDALAKGPLTRPELHDAVPELKKLSHTGWGSDVKGLGFTGELVLAPSGPGPTRFAKADDWLGPYEDDCPEFDLVLKLLLRRYLRAHGPASVNDYRYWVVVYARPVKRAFAELMEELTPVEIEGLPGPRYVLTSDLDELRSSGKPSGVRLLAKFDPLLMAHHDKRLYLDPKHHKRIFQKAGQVEASVLIDGRVAGFWRLVRKARSAQIVVQPFRAFKPRELSRMEKEGDRLGKALGLGAVEFQINEPG